MAAMSKRTTTRLFWIVICLLALSLSLDSFYQAQPLIDAFFETHFGKIFTKKKTTVAICAVQKHALPYLDEWVDYHLHAVGFDHIFLYDNSDDFESKAWLENRAKLRQDQNATQDDYGDLVPLYDNFFSQHDNNSISSLGVTIQHVQGESIQMQVYQKCAKRIDQANLEAKKYQKKHRLPLKNKIDWIAFIDVDEFIVLKKHDTVGKLMDYMIDKCSSEQNEALRALDINTNEEINLMSGLTLNVLLFDFNDQINYDHLPVTKRFTRGNADIKALGKSIAMVDRIDIKQPPKNAHRTPFRPFPTTFSNKTLQSSNSIYVNGRRPHHLTVNTNCRQPFPNANNFHEDIAVIHHYYTKSIEEFQWRCQRGNVFRTFETEEWQKKVFCWNSTEAINYHLHKEASNANMSIDQAAWIRLYQKVPKYRKYNDPDLKYNVPWVL